MSDKMREALQWLADEMRDSILDDASSLPQRWVEQWIKHCDAALAEQPAQGEACEHGTVPAGMTCEVCYGDWNAGRRGPPHPPLAAPTVPPAPAVPALELTSRMEARSGGRVWLTIMLDGTIVGQLCVPEAAAPALNRMMPLVSSAPKARHQEDALVGGEPPFARQDSQ